MKNNGVEPKSKPQEIYAEELRKIADARIKSQSTLLSEKIIEYFFENATTLAENGQYNFIFSYANFKGLNPPFDRLVHLASNSLKPTIERVEEIVKNRLSSLGFNVQFWDVAYNKYIGISWFKI